MSSQSCNTAGWVLTTTLCFPKGTLISNLWSLPGLQIWMAFCTFSLALCQSLCGQGIWSRGGVPVPDWGVSSVTCSQGLMGAFLTAICDADSRLCPFNVLWESDLPLSLFLPSSSWFNSFDVVREMRILTASRVAGEARCSFTPSPFPNGRNHRWRRILASNLCCLQGWGWHGKGQTAPLRPLSVCPNSYIYFFLQGGAGTSLLETWTSKKSLSHRGDSKSVFSRGPWTLAKRAWR